MPTTSKTRFDFRKRVAYDADAKRSFHINARRQLRALAAALGLRPGDYDLRSNQGGIAVMWNVRDWTFPGGKIRAWKLICRNCRPMFATCPGRPSG